LNDKKSI